MGAEAHGRHTPRGHSCGAGYLRSRLLASPQSLIPKEDTVGWKLQRSQWDTVLRITPAT